MTSDIRFSQLSLKETMAEVRALVPDHKQASVFKVRSFRDTWEFRFREFYWADKAANAYDARDKGWQAWIREQQYQEWKRTEKHLTPAELAEQRKAV